MYIFRHLPVSPIKAWKDMDIHVATNEFEWYALKVQKVIQETNSMYYNSKVT